MEHSFNAVSFTQNYPIAAKSHPQLGLNTETNASKLRVVTRATFVRETMLRRQIWRLQHATRHN